LSLKELRVEHTMKATVISLGIAFALTCGVTATLNAQDLSVQTADNNDIGEYGLNGSTLNGSVISGLNHPWAIAIISEPGRSTVALAALGLGVAALWLRRRDV
jgi:MYXO-CTERM domain-containing protein